MNMTNQIQAYKEVSDELGHDKKYLYLQMRMECCYQIVTLFSLTCKCFMFSKKESCHLKTVIPLRFLDCDRLTQVINA